MTFLFWNIHHNAVDEHLVRLVNSQQPDVLALAESTYPVEDLANLLNHRLTPGAAIFSVVTSPSAGSKVQVLSRRTKRRWREAFAHDRYTGWVVPLEWGEDLLFVAVHFPDARYEQGDGQRKTAIELRHSIEAYEKAFASRQKNRGKAPHSLLMGDFNASPFDAGIAGFYGLNASAHRDIVAKHGSRTIGGQTIKFYYNPMWRFLGHPTTPGTYFDRLSAPICYDWFMLDQVLISPGLLPFVANDAVQILDWDAPEKLGGVPLTKQTEGTPRRPIPTISDHLPLLLRINL